MSHRNRHGKVNVKLLVILILVTTALGVSLVAARQVRRSILSKMSLETGENALEKGDWVVASKNLQEYLGRNPDDIGVLKKYAQARLSIRPLERANLNAAISAYRRVLQLAPLPEDAEVAYEQLALLYTARGDFEELAYVARMRRDRTSKDPNAPHANDWKAPLWLAKALVGLNKTREARETLEKLVQELELLPEKHLEYVKACVQLSQLTTGPSSKAEAEAWLNKAITYDPHHPNSVEALVYLAQFYRQTKDIPDPNGRDKVMLAREKLAEADAIGTDDPQIRYLLGCEWLAHQEYAQAATELEAIDNLSPQVIERFFFDMDSWRVARFRFKAELDVRRNALDAALSLADETLAALSEKRHRLQVLPRAIPIYVAAGEAAQTEAARAEEVKKARNCLNEYLDLLPAQKEAKPSPAALAYLQAIVAKAENNWSGVMGALQPVVESGTYSPELGDLLLEALSRIDQRQRAVGILTACLRHDPGNANVTLQLAREYLRRHDWDKALEAARRLPPTTDFTTRLLRVEAGVYQAAGRQPRPPAAVFAPLSEELARLRADRPGVVDIRILQAVVADCLGQPQQVEAELRSAITQCQEPLPAEMQLAGYYCQAKRLAEALKVCQEACQRPAQVAEPWIALSNLHAAQEDYEAARSDLRQGLNAVTSAGEKRSLSMQLARLELRCGDRTAGIKLLSDLAAQDPGEVRARTLLLQVREVRADPARAQQLVDELRQAEGASGLWWRIHQAALWLSSEQWQARQQDIVTLLRDCIDSDPQGTVPALLLAGLYEKRNDPAHVEETCRQALLRNPSATEIRDRLIGLLERQGRFSEAEEVLRKVGATPQMITAWKIGSAFRAGDFAQVIEELKVQASNDSRDADSRIRLARLIYEYTKDAVQALKYLQEAEAIAPDSMPWAQTKAAILTSEGRPEEARKLLDDCVERRKDFAAYRLRAAYLVAEGRADQAEQDYRKLTTFAGRGVAGYQLLSNFYADRKDVDRAVATLEEGLGTYPGDRNLERALMKVLFRRAQGQDRDRAMKLLNSLEQRLPQDPELMEIHARLLVASNSMECKQEGLKLFQQVAVLLPSSVDVRLGLASAFYQTGDAAQAQKIYRAVLEQDPNNVRALNDLAWILQERDRRYEEALALADKGLGLTPNDTNLLDTRGTILSKLSDRLAEARKDFEKLVASWPEGTREKARALLQLGRVCAKLNDLTQASQHFQQALLIDQKVGVFTVQERSEIAQVLPPAGK